MGLFRFEDSYQYESGKFLCEGWCCRYAPSPRDPREPEDILSAEEQVHIEELKRGKVYSRCYFSSLKEICEALDFELWYCIHTCKVREAQGEFVFKGESYAYSRVFDFETDTAWVEIKDKNGNLVYGKGVEAQ